MSLEKDFEIIEHLGKEEKCSILKVKRKKDGVIYFLKSSVLNKLDEDYKESAINEIKILSSLNHPNIIKFKEAFFDKTTKSINLVLEFPDNGNLSNKINFAIKNKMYMEECIIWHVLTQILHGLNYLHQNGIVHRNLISKNIFLNKNRIVKIANFAASCKLEKNKMLTDQVGTPFYTAPEIWNEQPYNYKCDIWSVGCIIYELASLSLPYTGEGVDKLYENIMSKKYKPIPEFYSENLKKIINYMLISDPSKRPSTDILLNYPNIKEKTNQMNNIYLNYRINEQGKKSRNRRIMTKNLTGNINSSKYSLDFSKDINQENNKVKGTKLLNNNWNSIKKQNSVNKNKNDYKIRIIKNRTYRSLKERKDDIQKLSIKKKNMPISKSLEKIHLNEINNNKNNFTPVNHFSNHDTNTIDSYTIAPKDINLLLNDKNKYKFKFNNKIKKINQEYIKTSTINGNNKMKNINGLNLTNFNKINQSEKKINKYKKFEISKKEFPDFFFNRYGNRININKNSNGSKECISAKNKSNIEKFLYCKNLDLQNENINQKKASRNLLNKISEYMIKNLSKRNNKESKFYKKSLPQINIDISNFNKICFENPEAIKKNSNNFRNIELYNNTNSIEISQKLKNRRKNYRFKRQSCINNEKNQYNNNTDNTQFENYSKIVPIENNNIYLEKIDHFINKKPINFNESQILSTNNKIIRYKSDLFNSTNNKKINFNLNMGYKYLNKIKGNEDISINIDKEEGKIAANKLKKYFFKKNTKFPDNENFVYNNK